MLCINVAACYADCSAVCCLPDTACLPLLLLLLHCFLQAVLREVCKGAQALGAPGFVSKTYLSFYAVLLCEVLAACPQVTEQLLTGLLPFLVAGLKDSAARDYRAATLMVLTQLLSKAQLSKDFLAGVYAAGTAAGCQQHVRLCLATAQQ